MDGKRLKQPVVIVHGLGDSPKMPWWGFLRRHLEELDPEVEIHSIDLSLKVEPPEIIEEKLLERGGQLSVPGTALGSIKDYSETLSDFIDGIGEEVDIIAHSLGGLVSRWYVEMNEGSGKVDDLVTLATPHQGTYMAYMGIASPAGREMLPTSPLLHELNSESLPEDVNYTAVWGGKDHVYFQKWRAKLPENLVVYNRRARNIYGGEYDHLEMVYKKEIFDRYKRFIG